MGKYCPLCRGGRNASIVVHYERIAEAFTDRGMLAPEIHDLAGDHLSFAKQLSPKRTGRMAGSHYKRVMPAVGYTRKYFVGVSAGYAKFVRFGTAGNGTGYIVPKRGEMLELRPRPYSWFAPDNQGRFRQYVMGQKAQRNWLALAGSEAMAWNGLGSARFPNLEP
jgi:hypothetical protein